MKNSIKIIIAAAIISLSSITSCKKPQNIDSSYAYASFKTECLGTELDGSVMLRTWGKGTNKADAIEQARKNAVRDIIFNGITDGSAECNKKPLILEVNAQEKYEYYFNQFFATGGAPPGVHQACGRSRIHSTQEMRAGLCRRGRCAVFS